MTNIFIKDNESYILHTHLGTLELTAEDINSRMIKNQILDDLKDISVSISRAVEEGNDLRLGIVIGQVLSKINNIINEVSITTN
jgi:hypothetical protein